MFGRILLKLPILLVLQIPGKAAFGPDSGSSMTNASYEKYISIRPQRYYSNANVDHDNRLGGWRRRREEEEVGWSIINEEVDMVIPLLLQHLQKLGVEYLSLPDMKEAISLTPLIFTTEAGLFLTNGIVYNVAGIQRYGSAYMTYRDKAFLSRFYLIVESLQFEYNFLIKVIAVEGYGKVVGTLEDTIIYAELVIDITNFKSKLKLKYFRVIKFRNIRVQLDQTRIIGQLTAIILSPITNLFKDRIATLISDSMREQMQTVMDDFSEQDPLNLRKFAKQLLGGLTGHTGDIR